MEQQAFSRVGAASSSAPSVGGSAQRRSMMPTTSYPCSLSSAAATELSTPPLIPTTTRAMGSPTFLSLVAIGRYRATLLTSGAGNRDYPKYYMICDRPRRIRRAVYGSATPPGNLPDCAKQHRT